MANPEPKEFLTVLEKFDGNLWYYYLPVPAEIAQLYISEVNERRVICTLNKNTSFQCALMPKGDGNYFINLNKKLREKLKLNLGAQLTISLEKDLSEYGLPISEEFQETLIQDEEGSKFFHALTPGKRRTLIYMAGSVKDTQKRINRAIAILEHLKNNQGKINYKQLQEGIRLMG